MKPGIPWSVKGVEPELREIAKTAARRSGMTLGEWLNSAINEQADGAAPAGDATVAPARAPRHTLISTHPIERAATKLEDIAEQLSRLAARDSENAYRPPHMAEDPLAFAKVMSRVESNEKQTVEAFSAVNERLATISRQMSRGQQAAAPPAKVEEAPGFQAMEKAVRNIVEHLEISDKRTRDNMKSLQERMAEMTNRVASSSSEQVLRQVPAFSQLENRLTDLARRIEQPQPAALQSDHLRAELDQLAGRIETVHQTAESLANRAQTQAVQTAQAELRAIEQRITSLLNDARQSISADHMGPAEIERFRNEIDKVNARIDDSARTTASDRDVSALKVAVEQLSTRVAQGQDPRPMADLDKRLVEISQKLERTEAATRGLPQINDLEQRFAELDHRLAQSINNPGASNNTLLTEKLSEVDDRLSRTEHQLSHLETIERAISQLYDTIEQNRKSAHQVAHDTAARMAEKFAGQAQAAVPVSLANAPEIMALQSGLQAVREAAKSADSRNQETLEAVHETLEQIVGKLTELETAAIGQRLAQATSPVSAFAQVAEPVAAFEQTHHFEQTYHQAAAAPEPVVPEPSLAEAFAALVPEPAGPGFAPTPEPANFMNSVFAEAGHAFDGVSAPAMGAAGASVDGSIGDLVAAARRLHQASHSQANPLSGVKPAAKPKAKAQKSKGLSLPFLKMGSTKKNKDFLSQPDPASILKPANGNASSNRVRLIALGLMFLAMATFAVSNMAGRLHHAAAPATPAVIEPQGTTEPPAMAAPPAAAAAPAPAPAAEVPAQQPEPAPLAKPEGKAKTNTTGEQQGDASAVMQADPILTGAITSAKGDNLATASATDMASVALDPAIGTLKLRHAAESGDSSAQFIVATHFLNGDTVPVDYPRAAYWYGKSAAAGVAPAQYRLATLYERGKGVDKNLSAALSWYERAAALGNIKAMHNAAVIAAGNEAGAPDYNRAFKWFSLAASHGVKDSQFNLAVLIERGLGTRQNNADALFWYMAAAQQEDADAKTHVESLSKTLGAATVEAAKARLKAFVPEKAPDAANIVAVNDAQWNPDQAARTLPANINDQAKALLDKLGYRVGDQDGALDVKTANAIKLFQMKQGMKVTGNVTPDLISKMQAKAG
jgi:localization factor PodJL